MIIQDIMRYGSVKPSTLADSMASKKSYSDLRKHPMHICDLHKFTDNILKMLNILYHICSYLVCRCPERDGFFL